MGGSKDRDTTSVGFSNCYCSTELTAVGSWMMDAYSVFGVGAEGVME